MRFTSILRYLSLPIFTLISVQSIPQAQAGFQWVPSDEAPTAIVQDLPAVPPVPVTNEQTPPPNDILVPMIVNPTGDMMPLVANPPRENLSTNSYIENNLDLQPAVPQPLEPSIPEVSAPVYPAPEIVDVAPPLLMDGTPPPPTMKTKKIGTRKSDDMQARYATTKDKLYNDIQAAPVVRSYNNTQKEGLGVRDALGIPDKKADMQKTQDAWTSRRVVPNTPSAPILNNAVVSPAPIIAPVAPPMAAKKTDVKHNQYRVVEGFGSDLPLALALSQVVPPEYSYSFGENVNAGTRVSWSGGKPWSQVVDAMASAVQLNAIISGKTVFIQKGQVFDRSSLSLERAPSTPEPMQTKRANIMDPGEISAPAAPKSVEQSRNHPAMDFLTPIPQDTRSPSPQVAPTQLSGSYPEQAANREKMSERIQRDIHAQNIEMRMSDSMVAPDVFAEAQSYQPGRVYSVRPDDLGLGFQDPPLPEFVSAQQMERHSFGFNQPNPNTLTPVASTPQKNATFSQGRVPARKVSGANRRVWEAQKGASLKNTLVKWSRDANVNLVWNAPRDYTVSSDILVNGTFKNAIKAVFSDGMNAQNTPSMQFVDDPNTNQATTFIIGDRS